jgi:hypothetical protein
MNDLHYNREFPGDKEYPESYGMAFEAWVPMMNPVRREEKEREYWKQMYPAQVKEIQRVVEQLCDRIDYKGSFIYDEYPDQVTLKRLCDGMEQVVTAGNPYSSTMTAMGICNNCSEPWGNRILPPVQPVKPPAPPMPGPGGEPVPPMPEPGGNLRNLIEVLLYDELAKRRRNQRRYENF